MCIAYCRAPTKFWPPGLTASNYRHTDVFIFRLHQKNGTKGGDSTCIFTSGSVTDSLLQTTLVKCHLFMQIMGCNNKARLECGPLLLCSATILRPNCFYTVPAKGKVDVSHHLQDPENVPCVMLIPVVYTGDQQQHTILQHRCANLFSCSNHVQSIDIVVIAEDGKSVRGYEVDPAWRRKAPNDIDHGLSTMGGQSILSWTGNWHFFSSVQVWVQQASKITVWVLVQFRKHTGLVPVQHPDIYTCTYICTGC